MMANGHNGADDDGKDNGDNNQLKQGSNHMIEFKLTIENQRSFNLCTCEELRKVSLCFAFSKSFKFDAYNTCENATCKTQHYDGWMRR